MDLQNIINTIIGVLGGLLGWIVRILWEEQQQLRKDMQKLPETYVRRDDWKDQIKEVKDMLAKIFDKLDGKADKSDNN